MTRSPRILIAILASALVFAAAGCGRVAPTSPDVDLARSASLMPDPAPGDPAGGSTDPQPGSPPPSASTVIPSPNPGANWVFIQDPSRQPLPGILRFVLSLLRFVQPIGNSLLHTGRWSLQFHTGSLSLPRLISIAQASDATVRVQFGPDGTRFGTPVDLTISYAGTSLDPASSTYHGQTPVFVWFDPSQSKWVELPFVNDTAAKVLRVKLQHFSTYGVGGRAGW
jgi:hypothetical protein